MVIGSFIVFVVFLLLFLFVLYFDRRNLFLGIFFIATGLSFIFYDGFLELFLQQTIQPEIDFGTDNRCNYLLALPSAAGFRIWY